MDDWVGQWIFPLAFGALAASRGVYEMVRRARARRRVAGGSTQLDDNALVTLRGTVFAFEGVLVAPLSGRRCVAYHACARVYDPRTRPRVTVHERIELAGLTLHCPAGQLGVEAQRVELALKRREIRVRDNPAARAFIAALGLPYLPDVTTCDEIIVEQGQLVTVHGVVRVEAAPASPAETGFREVARAVRIVGDERHPLVITDA